MRDPDFLIIGAAKSATTSLADQLRRHPQIGIPSRKELNHFSHDLQFEKGIDHYRLRLAEAGTCVSLGEASPTYTLRHAYPHAAERISRHLPGVRLVFIARDPIRRIESQHLFDRHVKKRPAAAADFAADVEHRRELIDGSRYAWMLEPYLDRFPRSRMLFLTFEDYQRDPIEVCGRVQAFLGVDVCEVPATSASNSSGSTPEWFGSLVGTGLARLVGRSLPPETRRRIRYLVRRRVSRPIWPEALRRRVEDELRADALEYLKLAERDEGHWGIGTAPSSTESLVPTAASATRRAA